MLPFRGAFDRPVFIVSAPRAGSTLLFETLSLSPSAWTIGGESHGLEAIPGLNPASRGFDSNRLTAEHADPKTAALVKEFFAQRLRDRASRPPSAPADGDPSSRAVRLVEKTPKNALRIP